MRDFMAKCEHKKKGKKFWKDKIKRSYVEHFDTLRSDVNEFSCKDGRSFRCLKTQNYEVLCIDKLYHNLCNTEIDVVLETDQYLFIGEAKYKTALHANSKYVLVHQLVRQYVMAKILVDLCEEPKCVVPFVVGVDPEQEQVKFMIKQHWMNKKNILCWKDIEAIRG
ncbi:MAG: hypothetical protein OXP11_07080 [Gammaproteobacteria bacterium]|nr:hypothetical protein [Gammaproteobacteria bacterium]